MPEEISGNLSFPAAVTGQGAFRFLKSGPGNHPSDIFHEFPLHHNSRLKWLGNMRALTLLLSLGLFFGAQAAESHLVVINEFGQGKGGNGEWIELLVVGNGPCSTVDLRGWTIRDYQGNATGGVYVVFSNDPVWQAVPAGTLILVYNGGQTAYLPDHFPPHQDTDFTDGLVVLPHNHPWFAGSPNRWEGLGNPGDWILLLDKDRNLVDGLSYGNKTGESDAPEVKLGDVGSTKAAWFLGSSTAQINDLNFWAVGNDASGGSTPGAPNTAANRDWINSLRPKPVIQTVPNSHDFGIVAVGLESLPLEISVSNAGCADLFVQSVTLSGPNAAEFEIRNDNVSGATIPGGEARSLQVVFKPASRGPKIASLLISSTDPVNPQVTILLTGAGEIAGDVNGDGFVDILDLRLTYQAALGLLTLSPEEKRRADLNGNSEVDMGDVELLCRLVLGGCG